MQANAIEQDAVQGLDDVSFKVGNIFDINPNSCELCSTHNCIDTSAVVSKPFAISLFIAAVAGNMVAIILDQLSNFNNHEACLEELLEVDLRLDRGQRQHILNGRNYSKAFVSR